MSGGVGVDFQRSGMTLKLKFENKLFLVLVQKRAHFAFRNYDVFIDCFDDFFVMKMTTLTSGTLQTYFASYSYEMIGMNKNITLSNLACYFTRQPNFDIELQDSGLPEGMIRMIFRMFAVVEETKVVVIEFWLTLSPCH